MFEGVRKFLPRIGGNRSRGEDEQQVDLPNAALSTAVANARALHGEEARKILAALGTEVGLRATDNRGDAELDLRASIRDLIAARDRQIAELQRDLLAPRLERLRRAAAENDLEELRHQIGQLEESVGGLVRSLGAKWP